MGPMCRRIIISGVVLIDQAAPAATKWPASRALTSATKKCIAFDCESNLQQISSRFS
jgi:hypothetical protein